MCDTLAVCADSNKLGKMLFAKNSDRSPNEPHLMIEVKPKKNNLVGGPTLKATYIEIEQVAETLGCVLLKPSWTWGCEMGINERGVCIGNEAVFTRGKYGETALIGMDICRLVLERAETARAGVELIGALLERYGQGGNCGYDHNFEYDNSYLIADEAEAWVVETAGRLWVAKPISELNAISNALSIGGDYELGSSELLNQRVNFARKYTNGTMTSFSGAVTRRFSVLRTLIDDKEGRPIKGIMTVLGGQNYAKRAEAPGIDIETLKNALRYHAEDNSKAVENPCMHYGGVVGDHTTGSFIAVPADRMIYVTGSSLPCRSIFKPLSLRGALPLFQENEQDKAARYWYDRELISRNFAAGVFFVEDYLDQAAALERQLGLMAAEFAEADEQKAGELNKQVFALEQQFVDHWLGQCTTNTKQLTPKGYGPGAKARWNKKNAVFLSEREALL